MKQVIVQLRQIAQYPSAIAGVLIILFLVAVALYAMITIPIDEALQLWRGSENVWAENPRTAWPVWYNFFTEEELPPTLALRSDGDEAEISVETLSENITEKLIVYTFDYPYEAFPQELTLFTEARYLEKRPHLELTWIMPDGREIRAGDFIPRESSSFRFAQEERLQRRLGGLAPQIGLFADPETAEMGAPEPLQGVYRLRISALLFEEESDVETTLVLYGQVHGLAGTDHRRRDLMVALLWGTPIAARMSRRRSCVCKYRSE